MIGPRLRRPRGRALGLTIPTSTGHLEGIARQDNRPASKPCGQELSSPERTNTWPDAAYTRARVSVHQPFRLGAPKLADVDATDVRRTRHVKQKVPPSGRNCGKQ